MKLIRNAFSILMLLAVIFGAASGILGASATFILSGVENNAQTFALFWPQGGNYGFVFLNSLGQAGQLPNGLKVDGLTAAEITQLLQSRGWVYTAAGTLPAAVRKALGAPSVFASILSFRGMPTVILAPVILFAPTEMPEG